MTQEQQNQDLKEKAQSLLGQDAVITVFDITRYSSGRQNVRLEFMVPARLARDGNVTPAKSVEQFSSEPTGDSQEPPREPDGTDWRDWK